ncbi:two component transcriptional regulator, winged helix family [Anaeromyxobacter dehalogenans 2CP-1]|uniref:Two component transcriptional regulator, winged helix family n=1 Tax=Anaeromyxobacter dehalogenans (strain ATCC BAA-258 / DSM 21875 / 2CP-1) TaxID=455488 RepID=B8JAG9_ANAD2|nr:response regulator [Anaeromyxobacter dehalogenans]ACL67468.1 two component transcriptional regulator, winged helix family [Anaeromyxobacter dehalogenans 2CP-1]
MTSVLLVDDERDLLSLLDFNLRASGFETLLATTGEQALSHLRRRVPDLVLLDVMLPDVSGTEVCRQIKSDPRTRHVPVVMLTAKGDEVDRVVGFELGADDYVTKPFSVRELVLRLKAVLRRAGARPSERPPESVGPIRVDVESHRVYVDGAEVVLTPLEFKLLTTLMSRLGRVQSRDQLLEDVWEMSAEVETRTVDTHVKRLREKLGSGRDLLETVRGIGYRLVDPSEKR